MSQPSVNIVELDGNIGVLPSGQTALAIIGVASSGPIATPAAFGDSKGLATSFTRGMLVEAGSYHLAVQRLPIIAVRAAATTAGTMGTIDVTGVTGTATDTTATGVPTDEMELVAYVVTGFTAGTTGGVVKLSYDGGRTYGPNQAQGTSLSIAFTDCGTAAFTLVSTKTLVAGDVIKCRTNSPKWNASDITAAINALMLSAIAWDLCLIAGNVSGAEFDTISALFANTDKTFICHYDLPLSTQTEATYKTAFDGALGSKSSTYGCVAAGACKMFSAVSGRTYRRSPAWVFASEAAASDADVDVSAPALGALSGIAIRDNNGNVDEHDESANPGLDDSRAVVLRTIAGYSGVFINNPNMFSPAGSDFKYLQHRRLMNIAKRTLKAYFTLRLSQPVKVDAVTGYIDPAEADEIERGADAAIRAALMAKPMISGGGVGGKASRFVQISRTDNLLSTFTMTVQASIIPKAYPKTINISLGFRNPALQFH